VCVGDTDPTDAFDASVEWNVLAQDTFDGLGTHTADCGAPANAPIVLVCDAPLTTDVGVAATAALSGSDSDGTVVDIAVAGIVPALAGGSIVIDNLVPAGAVGGTATADLVVDADVPSGEYTVAVTATNDDAAPQTDDCTQLVTVVGPPSVVPIYIIQGDGDASLFDGDDVLTEGVVTADFQGDDALNGFFIQDPGGDGDVATSDGIFVFDGAGDVDVSVGDFVQVAGTVDEFFGLTEITSVDSVEIIGSGSIAPIDLAVPGTDQESVEGMLLTVPQTMTVTDQFNLHRFGEVVLSSNGRQFQPTNFDLPAPDFDNNGNSIADVLEPFRLLLDDASTAQFPATIPYLRAPGTLRLGDTIDDLTGVLGFSFGSYRFYPTQEADFVASNPRPAGAPDVGGELVVSSFNVLNYWTTIDDGDNGARGADSAAEFARQQEKLVTALLASGADVVGLQELENNGPTAIGDLVEALNAATAPDTWAAVPDPAYPGGLEATNAIKVGIIYRTDSVSPVGDSIADPDPIFAEDRPPIAQKFQAADGERFTLVVNHFKSKGSSGATGADLDQNDGQGAYNARRTAQAEALLDFVDELAAAGDPDVLVVGDFNSYAMEDPITTLEGGLANLIDVFVPSSEQYSFVFFGMSGLLDFAFANSEMTSQVVDTAIWHINADEPRVLDYNDDIVDSGESASAFNQDVFDPTDPFRASDHDPVLIGLDLGAVDATVTATPGVLWPPDHKYVTVEISAVDASGDPLSVEIVDVTSSEPDSTNPGDKPNDIVILGPSTVDLRAERYSPEGRTYTITAVVTSVSGQVQMVTTTVVVPHDQGV
jgi:predicted extracellular nuclease